MEITEEEYKVGDKVRPIIGPHKNHPHEIIHIHANGKINIRPIGIRAAEIKYKLGAATASPNELVKENSISNMEITEEFEDFKKITHHDNKYFSNNHKVYQHKVNPNKLVRISKDSHIVNRQQYGAPLKKEKAHSIEFTHNGGENWKTYDSSSERGHFPEAMKRISKMNEEMSIVELSSKRITDEKEMDSFSVVSESFKVIKEGRLPSDLEAAQKHDIEHTKRVADEFNKSDSVVKLVHRPNESTFDIRMQHAKSDPFIDHRAYDEGHAFTHIHNNAYKHMEDLANKSGHTINYNNTRSTGWLSKKK